jgi:thioredoxin-related protein
MDNALQQAKILSQSTPPQVWDFPERTPIHEYRGSTGAELILFTSKGCPFCSSFQKSWSSLKRCDIQGVKYTNHDVDEMKELSRKHKVSVVPTLLLKVGNKHRCLKYKGEMKKNDIVKWMKTKL